MSVGRDNIFIRLDNTDGKNECEALHQIRSSSTPANLAFLFSCLVIPKLVANTLTFVFSLYVILLL